MTTLTQNDITFSEPQLQEFDYLIANPNAMCSYRLTEDDIAGLCDESYMVVVASVYQDIDIRGEDFQVGWHSGVAGEYKGRDSGEDTDRSVFTVDKGILSNEYYLVHSELEPFYYGEAKGSAAALNAAFEQMNMYIRLNDEEAELLHTLMHKNKPTHESLDVITDINQIVFGVETDVVFDDGEVRREEVDKKWSELKAGDLFSDVRDNTRDV